MIFIRAWYIQTPQQPPPPDLFPLGDTLGDNDVAYGDSED